MLEMDVTLIRSAIAVTVLAAGCGGSAAGPSAPSTASGTSGSTDTSPLRLELPIAVADSSSLAYTIWPFGVHDGAHALDGHSGFDIEYRLGAPVLAAADGIVQTIGADAHDPSRYTVQLRHPRAVGNYATDYSNLTERPAAIVVGATVTHGQVLGIAGSFSGGGSAMTHFQLADPTVRNQPTVIVSPETYFSAGARAQLDELWRRAAYRAEWCEPLLTNPVNTTFPITRTWTLQSGTGPAAIVLTCSNDQSDPAYTFRDAGGSITDTGTLSVNFSARPTTATFRSSGGPSTSATYDIVSERMDLSLGANGLVYRTN